MSKFKVITLCGSTKFKKEFIEVQKRLTLEGNIVISVGLFGHSGDNEVWESMDDGTLTKTKQMLDDMHKEKINMSDEIFVINVGGYIGESTANEIIHAIKRGKIVNFLEEPKNFDKIQQINDYIMELKLKFPKIYDICYNNMRIATHEESKSVDDYIESISEPTGFNFFEDI